MNSYIKTLTLNNYRVYANATFYFKNNINIIYGKNGLGKTNILEAISFLNAGKGLLNASIHDILKIASFSPNYNWCAFANMENHDLIDTISVFSESENNILKKKIKINNNYIKNSDDLSKVINIIWLTPNMQNFFIDDKTIRRKFLDRIVSSIDNLHSSRILKYDFLIRERMQVLQDNLKFDKNWLNVLEEKISELGISIAVARNNIVRHLNRILFNYDFKFPKFVITLNGFLENMMLEEITSLQAEEKFRSILFNNRMLDKETKRTTEGIHKTDLRLFYSNKGLDAEFCSTGEQKLFLISFTILKALICKEFKKANVIILLDEIFSYLDKEKKIELYSELLKLDIQSFLTGTDISVFNDELISNSNILNLEKLI